MARSCDVGPHNQQDANFVAASLQKNEPMSRPEPTLAHDLMVAMSYGQFLLHGSASLEEAVYPEDPTSGESDIPTFHGYSASGAVVNRTVVYVNYCRREDFVTLGQMNISVDDTVEMLRPYVKDLKMNYPVLQGLNHDDIQNAYGPLFGIPVTIVISRDAKICAKHSGMQPKATFEKEIKSLL